MVDPRVNLKSIVNESHESASDNPSTIDTGRLTHPRSTDKRMKHLAAYLLLGSGGNLAPTTADIEVRTVKTPRAGGKLMRSRKHSRASVSMLMPIA
jgi:hypothetical protein